jgi:hypothetical protein
MRKFEIKSNQIKPNHFYYLFHWPTAQYKNRNIFISLCLHEKADGTAKLSAAPASSQGGTTVFRQWLSFSYTTGVCTLLKWAILIIKQEEEEGFMQEWAKNANVLTGSQRLHAFVSVQSNYWLLYLHISIQRLIRIGKFNVSTWWDGLWEYQQEFTCDYDSEWQDWFVTTI